MSHGYVPDDYIDLLAGKLSAIGNRGEKEEVEEFRKLAGFWPQEFAGELYEALKRGNLPPFSDVNDENRERQHSLVSAPGEHRGTEKDRGNCQGLLQDAK